MKHKKEKVKKPVRILTKLTCLQNCEVLGVKAFKEKEEMILTDSKKDQSLGNQLVAGGLFKGEYIIVKDGTEEIKEGE